MKFWTILRNGRFREIHSITNIYFSDRVWDMISRCYLHVYFMLYMNTTNIFMRKLHPLFPAYYLIVCKICAQFPSKEVENKWLIDNGPLFRVYIGTRFIVEQGFYRHKELLASQFLITRRTSPNKFHLTLLVQ